MLSVGAETGRCRQTEFACPRCGHQFRRKYVPVGFLNDTRDERDRWHRLFNRIEAAISHHKKHTDKLFADNHDDALYAARDRILRDSAEGKG